MADPGFYAVKEVVTDGDSVARDILFTRLESRSGPVPESQTRLVTEAQSILAVLGLLFPAGRDAEFSRYFRQLLSFTRVGLVGDEAQPDFACRLLDGLKAEVVANESGPIKNRYMKKLGAAAAVLAAIAAVFGAIVWGLESRWDAASFATVSYFFVWAGAMAGVWLSFGIRKVELRFQELHVPERDRMEPVIRLVFAGLLAIVLALVFSRELVIVTVGDFRSSDFQGSVGSAILVGMLLGISEMALPSAVTKHAERFLDSKAA